MILLGVYGSSSRARRYLAILQYYCSIRYMIPLITSSSARARRKVMLTEKEFSTIDPGILLSSDGLAVKCSAITCHPSPLLTIVLLPHPSLSLFEMKV